MPPTPHVSPLTPLTPLTLHTIGHSTHPLPTFLSLLHTHHINLLIDVRAYPSSRRHPHFNQAPLAASLRDAHIDYQHFPDLGGRRKPNPNSHNTAWKNDSFRAYADYTQTPAFTAALARLIDAARTHQVAFMCAESHWSNCHRGLIADALKAAGHTILHINPTGPAQEHPYTSAARLINGHLSYRGDPDLFTPDQ